MSDNQANLQMEDPNRQMKPLEVDVFCIAVIPALNEVSTIGGVVDLVRPYVQGVIVVDDGSKDGTAGAAQTRGAVVFRNNSTKGYDFSVDRGVLAASESGADYVITLDADGQHNTDDIPRFLNELVSGNADIVVGNRGKKARITEYLFSMYAKYRVGVQDPICGLKAFSTRLFRDIGYFDRIGSLGSQILFEAKRRNYRVAEIPIGVKDREDKSRFGQGLIGNLKILFSFFKLVLNDLGWLRDGH